MRTFRKYCLLVSSLALLWIYSGCGPTRFERRIAQHRVDLTPLVDIGTKTEIAELYGPPHRKEVMEDAEFWSYSFSVNQRYSSSVYTGYSHPYHYYGHHYYHSYPHYPHYYSVPVYYTVPRGYELILRFDDEGILRHWKIRDSEEY